MGIYQRFPQQRKSSVSDFRDWTALAIDWVRSHLRPLITVGVIGVALLLVAAVGLGIWNARKNTALRALDQAYQRPSGSDEQLQAFLDVAKQYALTPSGKLALFEAALRRLQRGDHAASLEMLIQLEPKVRNEPLLNVATLHASAENLRALGKGEEACQQFQRAAAAPGNVLRLESLYQEALCREILGAYDAAAKLYRDVISTADPQQEKLKTLSEERIQWLTTNGHIAASSSPSS